MITLGIFLCGVLYTVLEIYLWIVIISAVLTWIEPNPYNPIVRAIYAITEPVFEFVRERLPVMFGGIDFSPLIVLLVIWLIQGWLLPEVQYSLRTMLM